VLGPLELTLHLVLSEVEGRASQDVCLGRERRLGLLVGEGDVDLLELLLALSALEVVEGLVGSLDEWDVAVVVVLHGVFVSVALLNGTRSGPVAQHRLAQGNERGLFAGLQLSGLGRAVLRLRLGLELHCLGLGHAVLLGWVLEEVALELVQLAVCS